ncbi:MAG: hypothetical protein ACXV2J_04985, partial [Actinomycetes bacterium]
RGAGGRALGLVLHGDTFFGDGAADDPGELRGLGAPAPLDPGTARELAGSELAAGVPTCVLLADRTDRRARPGPERPLRVL